MKHAAILLLCLSVFGCSYARARYHDALDMSDLGLTFSRTPQFDAYLNCPTVLPLGYGRFDGTFVGVMDGEFRAEHHTRHEYGLLLWGQERGTLGGTESSEGVGVAALALDNKKARKRPMCVHVLHVGWVGAIWNIRWWEIPDFALGFVGVDYMHDDK